MTRDTIRNEIKTMVKERRLPHIWGTEEECLRLAEIFSLDERQTEQLAIAALLHDITKYFSADEHLAYMETLGETVDNSFILSEKTLHALTGAYYARQCFPDAVDDDVFSAIRFHTTGRADMTLLEKLLYLADYIEPTRAFPDCVALRQYFYDRVAEGDPETVLHDTLILSFDMTISDLTRLRCPIHPDTVAARNFLVAQEDR